MPRASSLSVKSSKFAQLESAELILITEKMRNKIRNQIFFIVFGLDKEINYWVLSQKRFFALLEEIFWDLEYVNQLVLERVSQYEK